MKSLIRHSLLLGLSLLLPFTLSVQAHIVWIEPLADGKMAMRFAEWSEDPETSPGHLDSLLEPTAGVLDGDTVKPLQLSKQSDHILLAETDAKAVLTGKCDYGVMQRGGGPARRPIFYARWWPANRPSINTAANALDLLPSAMKAGHILVILHGEPVPEGVELTYHTPGAADVKLKTDATGHVQLPENKTPGLHLLTLGRYSEEKPGEWQGKPYGIASHSASLCWKVEAPATANN